MDLVADIRITLETIVVIHVAMIVVANNVVVIHVANAAIVVIAASAAVDVPKRRRKN